MVAVRFSKNDIRSEYCRIFQSFNRVSLVCVDSLTAVALSCRECRNYETWNSVYASCKFPSGVPHFHLFIVHSILLSFQPDSEGHPNYISKPLFQQMLPNGTISLWLPLNQKQFLYQFVAFFFNSVGKNKS